jgi:hypothetical protein
VPLCALCGPGLLRPNPELFWVVKRINQNGGFMSFLNRLLGKTEQPKARVQICVECGMPVADHKQWCSILQGQNDMKLKASEIKPSM